METLRLTAAQAMVRWLSVQMTPEQERFIEGVWAIFGHGNVAGLGEALHAHRGRRTELARALGISERTLYRRLKALEASTTPLPPPA